MSAFGVRKIKVNPAGLGRNSGADAVVGRP
jgi:hypothetical protein